MLCSRIILQKNTPTGDQLNPLPCRSWGCENCRHKRRRQLIAMAMAGNPNKMLTLTVSTSVGETPNERRRLLHVAWTNLRKRMVRKLKTKSISYMAFVEKTEAGEPHLHILLRCGYIHFKWYRRQMAELLSSPIIWIEAIKGAKKAAYYVSKYCTKEPAQFANMKRYWRSQNYITEKENKETSRIWKIEYDYKIREPYIEVVENRMKQGWALKPLLNGWIDFINPRHMQVKAGYIYYSPSRKDYRIIEHDR